MKPICTFLSLFLLTTLTSFAQTLLPEFCGTNGNVYAMARDGNTIYIGGEFTTVGAYISYGTSVDISMGAANLTLARPNGAVYTAVPDGSGGWYKWRQRICRRGVYKHSRTVMLNEGVNIINIPVGHLPAGNYIIQLSGATILKQTTLVKQ